jgi:hypothetical protein
MPAAMGLKFLLVWVFYKYIAPTALGSTSKLTPLEDPIWDRV